jgi:hypothetical protein
LPSVDENARVILTRPYAALPIGGVERIKVLFAGVNKICATAEFSG